jgi:phage shock protein A
LAKIRTMPVNNGTTPSKGKLLSDESISTNGSNTTANEKCAVLALSSSNRKRIVDETSLSPDEAKSLEERRAYNRECATRARKRVKQNIAQLENQIKELQDDKAELRRGLAAMEKRVLSLTNEKNELLAKIQATTAPSRSPVIYSNRIGGLTNTSSPSPQLLQLQLQQRQLNSLRARGFY